MVGSVEGTLRETVDFEATDVLVGMTAILKDGGGDKYPVKVGFTIHRNMRNGSII